MMTRLSVMGMEMIWQDDKQNNFYESANLGSQHKLSTLILTIGSLEPVSLVIHTPLCSSNFEVQNLFIHIPVFQYTQKMYMTIQWKHMYRSHLIYF